MVSDIIFFVDSKQLFTLYILTFYLIKQKSIGIAGGKSKAAAILSVIRASRQDILITDEAAAHEILKMAKEQ